MSESIGPPSSANPFQSAAASIRGLFCTPMRQIDLADPGSEPSGITTDRSNTTVYCFKLLDISIKIFFLKFTCAFPKDMIVLDLFCKKA